VEVETVTENLLFLFPLDEMDLWLSKAEEEDPAKELPRAVG
jgi:hypothetical protein